MINYLDLDEMVTRLQLCGRHLQGRHKHRTPKLWHAEGDLLRITEWGDDLDAVIATFYSTHAVQHLVVCGSTEDTAPANRHLIESFNQQQLRLLMADIDPEVMDVLRVCS